MFDEETLGVKYEVLDIPVSYQLQALMDIVSLIESDGIAEKLLDNKEVLETEIIEAIRIPAAFKNKGIQVDRKLDFGYKI